MSKLQTLWQCCLWTLQMLAWVAVACVCGVLIDLFFLMLGL